MIRQIPATLAAAMLVSSPDGYTLLMATWP
jgi:hypothetical protein